MPSKKIKERTKAHAGYPSKDVGEPNIGEREFETGTDESFKADSSRTAQQHSQVMLDASKHMVTGSEQLNKNVLAHYKRLDIIAERGLTNALTDDSHRNERVNQANMQATANIDQSNDTLLAILVEALKTKGTATISIK